MDDHVPSSTILCYPSESKSPPNIEVLNVNNVDSTGGVVLNDEKLLELIQLYPFLYNPRVRPFQDADYDDWAWNRITNAFNQSYEGLLPPAVFGMSDLKRRWEKLKPIIKKMAKMLDLTAIPEPLRQMIVKISVQLEDQTTDVRSNVLTRAQQIIYDNMAMVEQLPIEARLRLEAEIMDLILNAELDAKATIKLAEWNSTAVQEEYEELLNSMNMKELILLKSPNKVEARNDNSQEQIVTSTTTSNGIYEVSSSSINGDNSSDMMYELGGNDVDVESAIARVSKISKKDNNDKKNTNRKKWVNYADAAKRIKRCVVRIKRLNLEDHLPLSRISNLRRQRKNSTRF